MKSALIRQLNRDIRYLQTYPQLRQYRAWAQELVNLKGVIRAQRVVSPKLVNLVNVIHQSVLLEQKGA